MKAAVYKGSCQLVIEDVPKPEPEPGQILVKVKYCAICGTDVHAWLYDKAPAGTVMGHEYCGTIEKLGPGVTGWSLGERVVGGGGTPPPGKGPRFAIEPRFNFHTEGFLGKPVRAYAEFVVMEEWEPIRIPKGVSDEEAALCEPLGVAVRAVRHSKLKLGDSVAVIGAGPIGMFAVQAARVAGAGKVIVSEPAPARREAVRKLGADLVLDPATENVEQAIVAATDGLGPHIVFDCAGLGPTLDQAMNLARRDGQVILVALAWEKIEVLPVDWLAREVNLQGTFGAQAEDWQIALELLRSDKITVSPFLSKIGFIPIEDIQAAFESLVKPTTQLQLIVRLQ